ncbi:uncharacterized protein PFL1_04912 [Pseudozyma flocculosa PF-1]|uniref:UBC core domain-containing protein n=2 Tax=Pseudozyma flocculosa TaxID=84751 RepID=A0A5C3EVY4_9BASI|nr:uncharacterized protein PFL1_04912 [Pseudozyma flocculosa PF-1]EPQ27373.1 hypothetical protein PFL1_04912 [Pseudozyma flocculosa PF-1]SPO36212.1 uncharacterized protein PSFLO_01683 [Pseudozyma flocculosa]
MTTSQLRYEYGQRDISLQYAQLAYSSNCPRGIYVQLDDDDTHLWHAVVFLDAGPFCGGVFRFDVVFPPAYPLATPQVFFPPTLLHPLVEPNSGRMSLTTRFPTWKPRSDFATDLLYFVRDAFMDHTLEGLREGMVANLEVFRMYRDHRTLFNKLALQSVALSTSPSSLYDQSGGSGFPNPSVGLGASDAPAVLQTNGKRGGIEEANGMLFEELTDEDMQRLRAEIFGEA